MPDTSSYVVAIAIDGTGDVKLKNVTATSTGGNVATAIETMLQGTLTLENTNASASGASDTCRGISSYAAFYENPIFNISGGSASVSQCTNGYGIQFGNYTAVHTLNGVNVTAVNSANNWGIYLGNFTLKNSTVTAAGSGYYNMGISSDGNIVIDHSEVSGTTYSVYNYASGGIIRGSLKVAYSKLDGAFNYVSPVSCIGAYTANYVALGSGCQ